MVDLIADESSGDNFSLKDLLGRDPHIYDRIKKTLKTMERQRFERGLQTLSFKLKETDSQFTSNSDEVSAATAFERTVSSNNVIDKDGKAASTRIYKV